MPENIFIIGSDIKQNFHNQYQVCYAETADGTALSLILRRGGSWLFLSASPHSLRTLSVAERLGRGGGGGARLYLSAADETDQKVEREENGDEDLSVVVDDGKLVTQTGDDGGGAAKLSDTGRVESAPSRARSSSFCTGNLLCSLHLE